MTACETPRPARPAWSSQMIAKLRVFAGAFAHASAGETFCPVQFGFLAKLPAAFAGSFELSGMPGEVRRNAVGGPSLSCMVEQAASSDSEIAAAIVFIVRGSFLRSCGRSFP